MSIEVRRNTKLNGIEVVVADETKKRLAQIDKDLRSLGFMFSKRKNLYFTKYNKTLYKDVQEMFEEDAADESVIPFAEVKEKAKSTKAKTTTTKAKTTKAKSKTTTKAKTEDKQIEMFADDVKTEKPDVDLSQFVPALRKAGPRTELKGQYPDFNTWKSAVLTQVEELLDEAIHGLTLSINEAERRAA